MSIEVNQDRIAYLLELFGISIEDLMSIINRNRQRPFTIEDIQNRVMDLSLLKKIDLVFQQGLDFYMDYSAISRSENMSVFFRKTNFETQLNMESKRVVKHFEMLKAQLDSYLKLSDVLIKIPFPHFSLQDDPEMAAKIAREVLYPKCKDGVTDRDFLKAFIAKCAEQKIYIFEFIETWNKKETANIDGLFIGPNMIVLKRQKSYKREIFTLAHELGHCLLGSEEAESLDLGQIVNQQSISVIEKWCNNFAFYFLIQGVLEEYQSFKQADAENDYVSDLMDALSTKTHLSRLALYTRLRIEDRISEINYSYVKSDLETQFLLMQEQKKEEGKGGSTPKPILSPFYIDTMRYALYNGIVNETQFCNQLKIKPEEFNKYIY